MATQNSELEVVIRGRDELSPQLQAFESKIIRTVGFISAALAGIKIGTAPIAAAAAFEREMANVAKTTDFASKAIDGTIGNLDRLASALLDMTLRVDVTATDLAKIAAAAGQQGLGRFGVEGVAQFTDSVARMASVLDITADEAGTQVGKIINLFQIPLGNIEQAVSTFNEVANKSTASGEELLDVVKRIGDAAGSLDLGQAVALSASALDFGTSPEVAGSAFARTFSVFLEKAEEFGDLMDMSATGWIQLVKKDGVQAFKDYIKVLRTLDEQAQQAAIVKLTGGGRQGALINKFIQDKTDSILNRNLAASDDGEQGVSALREQATVLNTLDAQAKILRNSFVKLGIDSAKSLLGPLTQYTAQLSEALQSPGVQSFVGAVVKSVGQLIDQLATAVKFVASLNVNWENFLKVAQVLSTIKLATFGADLLGRMVGFGDSLKSISKEGDAAARSANAVAAATTAAGKAASASSLAQRLGFADAAKALNDRALAIRNLSFAEADLARKQEAARVAAASARVNTSAASGAATAVASAGGQVAQQREALRRAEAAATAAQAQQAAALAARIAVAEQESAARRLAIQQNYETRRAAITATGTQTGLKALRAARVSQLEEEAAAYQRSLRGIETYYTRRAATQNAALQQEIIRERAALMQRFSVFDGLAAEQAGRQSAALAAQASASRAKAAADAAAAGVGVQAAAARVSVLAIASQAASASVAALGVALRTLATAAVAAARILGTAFFWITILYSIADALKLIDKLGPAFQRVTDAVGITSKAVRDNAVAQEQARKAAEQLTAEIEAQTKAYKENTDVRTGQQNLGNVTALATQAGTADSAISQDKALGELGNILAGPLAATGELLKRQNEQTQKAADEQLRIVDDLTAKLAKKREDLGLALQFNRGGRAAVPGIKEKFANEIGDLERQVATAKVTLDTLQSRFGDIGSSATQSADDIKKFGNATAALFTPGSVKGLEEFVLPIAKARDEAEKLKVAFEKATQAGAKSGGITAIELELNAKKLADANLAVKEGEARLRGFIAAATSPIGVKPEVLNSYEALYNFLKLSTTQIEGFVAAQKSVDPVLQTGLLAPKPAAATSGDGKFTSDKQESEARKLSRARLLLRRAEIQAQRDLAEEEAKQVLAIQQRQYDQGLLAIKDYFDAREKIQQDSVLRDIASKRSEIDAVDFELQAAKDATERARFETDKVRLRGQISVLQEQLSGISAENDDARRKASQDFNDRQLAETNKLQVDQIIPADSKEIFNSTVQELLNTWREFMNQLGAKNPKLAEALKQSFNVEGFKKSIQPAMDAIDGAFSELQRLQTRINLSRQDNALSSVQAEQLYSETVRKQIPVLEAKLSVMQASLRELGAQGKIGSASYKQLEASIDGVRLRIQELAQSTDQLARSVNQSLTDSLATALDNLTKYGSSLKDVVNAFLLEVATNIKSIFTKDIAERISQGTGNTGSGGFGGFIQGALRGGQSGVARGTTPATPLYVQDVVPVDLPKSNEVSNAVPTAIEEFFTSIKEGFNSVFEGIKSFFGFGSTVADAAKTAETVGAATDVASAAGDTAETTAAGAFAIAVDAAAVAAGQLVAPLASLTLGLQPTPGALGSMAVAAQAATTAIGQMAAAAQASAVSSTVAHTGGIVGSGKLPSRMVHPGIFANARKYHGGGTAGLKTNEVPAILKKGEAVLTENQQSLVAAAMTPSGGGDVAIRNVLVVDPNFISDGLSSAEGEKSLLSFVTKNRVSLRQTLGVN